MRFVLHNVERVWNSPGMPESMHTHSDTPDTPRDTPDTPRTIPAEWTLGDRMRKSLHREGIGVSTMAELLGVSRGSVGNWTNDRVVPSLEVLHRWARITHVPEWWLIDGDRRCGERRGGRIPHAAGSGSTSLEDRRRLAAHV